MTAPLALVDGVQHSGVLVHLADLRERAESFAEASMSDATRRAYGTDLAHFGAWCRANDVVPLPAPPPAVALYLSECASQYRVATIARRIAAISREHRKAGRESPFTHAVVQDVWSGIKRRLGVAQDRKDAILVDDLRRMLQPLGETTIEVRDRALLLLGFAAAFRRSEIVALDVDDVRTVAAGLEVTLKRSKTDQCGEGRLVGIPYGSQLVTCPVRAIKAWRERSMNDDAALFRAVDRHGNVAVTRLTAQAVALIVKRHAERAGLDPARFGGHSLRAGFATSAALSGCSEIAIAAQTGHRSLQMVARYVRPASIWHGNPAAQVGL